MARVSRSVATICVAGLVAASCGVVGGGSVGPNPWTLAGVTPDGRQLLVVTEFGGVASGCSRFEGFAVDEADDQVEVTAQLWQKRFPGSCTEEAVIQTSTVDLEEPLGDRPLVGCGNDDCLAGPEWWSSGGGWYAVAATEGAGDVDGGVVVTSGLNAWSFDLDGQRTGEIEVSGQARLSAADTVAVVSNGWETSGWEPSTAQRLWSTEGQPLAAYDDALLLCRGDNADGLVAVEAITGLDRWT